MSKDLLTEMTQSFMSLKVIKETFVLKHVYKTRVWLKSLNSKQNQETSMQVDMVDNELKLIDTQQVARRILYSLCNEDGSPFVELSGDEDLQKALDVIDTWPSCVTASLIKDIAEINKTQLSDEDIEAGKSGSSKDD